MRIFYALGVSHAENISQQIVGPDQGQLAFFSVMVDLSDLNAVHFELSIAVRQCY